MKAMVVAPKKKRTMLIQCRRFSFFPPPYFIDTFRKAHRAVALRVEEHKQIKTAWCHVATLYLFIFFKIKPCSYAVFGTNTKVTLLKEKTSCLNLP